MDREKYTHALLEDNFLNFAVFECKDFKGDPRYEYFFYFLYLSLRDVMVSDIRYEKKKVMAERVIDRFISKREPEGCCVCYKETPYTFGCCSYNICPVCFFSLDFTSLLFVDPYIQCPICRTYLGVSPYVILLKS